jgi:hypothetical protein
MTSKHAKQRRPNDSDLRGNPLIGGSKGATMAGAAPDEVADARGENTFEGDVSEDVNPQGGVGKAESRRGDRRPK